ncbi:MAG TPA: hypothetical protein VMS86_03845 [Thermoanaerobaculia bacterium]|nr:hypothetical protein [Thermoanaerobaculia bacterium]
MSAEIGDPRARVGGGKREPIDLHAIWSGGTLAPPRGDVREEVVPPPVAGDVDDGDRDGSSGAAQGEFLEGDESVEGGEEPEVEEVEIPKTPEELYLVPPSYEIRFQEGLTIEIVRAEGAEAPAAAPSHQPGFFERLARWARRLSLSRPEGERARLRLVLASDDADRLFRSLPPDVKLLIRRSATD